MLEMERCFVVDDDDKPSMLAPNVEMALLLPPSSLVPLNVPA
jgi:hypothetical protein